MRPTARKIRFDRTLLVSLRAARFYAVIVDDGRPVWICAHTHETRKKANACARAQLKKLPRTGPAALRRLHATWTDQVVAVPLAEDGRPELRRSWVEAFLQCVQYQGDESPDAEWGSVVHDAIHAYWQLCIARGEESMLSEVERLVTEAFFRRPGADPNRFQQAVDVVGGFCESRLLDAGRLLVLDRKPVIEYQLRADIGWAWLIGRVDRIDRMDADDPEDPPRIVRVRDYKSGWASSGAKALEEGAPDDERRVIPHEFQRRFYAMLAFLDPSLSSELEEVETEIDYIRYRGEPQVVRYFRGELDGWWRSVLWALEQRWQQRGGPPTGCASCPECALRATCGAALTVSKAVPHNEEEARELAQEWIRAKELTASRGSALKVYAEKHDPFVVGGLEVGFLRPHDAQWKPNNARTIEIVKHLDLAGLNGEAATYPAGVASDKIPKNMRAALVEAGLARWEYGPPAFKSRKRGED